MALSDPVNVRLGAERRRKTLMKLAQQMASRAGGRAQGAGAMFRSNVQGRGSARPSLRLPFELPGGRTRPAGFDPNPGGPPVFESGPPSMGGGVGFAAPAPSMAPAASASATQYPVVTAGGWTGAVDPATGVPLSAGFQGFDMNGQWAGDTGIVTQSDMPLDAAPAPVTNYPDPWEIMTANQIRRLMGGSGGRMYAV